jgi:hypothetical protein
MAGYSQTPLVRKLGLKEGNQFYVSGSPVDYTALLGSLPDQAVQKSRIGKKSGFYSLLHQITERSRSIYTEGA